MTSGASHGRIAPTSLNRTLLWILAGVTALAAVLLKEVGGLLAAIETGGQRSYGASVFTGFKLLFWETDDLANAIRLWASSQAAPPSGWIIPPGVAVDVEWLLAWHLSIDAFLFVPAYALLMRLLLRGVGATPMFALSSALALVAVDEAETWLTYLVLVGWNLDVPRNCWLVLIQLLSLLKWTAITATLVTAVVLWMRPGGLSFRSTLDRIGDARRATPHSHGFAMMRLMGLVALFVALVALPAGGPLDQMPDVIRNQLEAEHPWAWLLSLASVLLFCASIAVSGFIATSGNPQHAPKEPLHSGWVVGGAGALSVLMTLLVLWADRGWSPVPAAPFVVVLGVIGAAWLARTADVASSPERATSQVPPAPTEQQRVLWIGGVAGVVLVAGGLGLVRAAFPPALLAAPRSPFWWSVTVIGTAATLLGGLTCQELARQCHLRLRRADGGHTRAARGALWLMGGLVVVLSVVLALIAARYPDSAHLVGSIGVVAIAGAFLALAIGGFTWISRNGRPWEPTRQLGFGEHTPWLTLVILSWTLASVINTKGVYHDVRVSGDLGAEAYTHLSVKDAFKGWWEAQAADGCAPTGDSVPMVLVAAPGGGIRAAYWTAAALDRLFGASEGRADCAGRRLFAVSGVSGGSIGTLTWMTSRAARADGGQRVARLSEDRGLAAAIAALLFRDIYQPLLGISTRWRDRAALLEDGWSASVPTLGTRDSERLPSLRWSAVGHGMAWVPLLMLNASSVSDGCRVVLTNVRGLAPDAQTDCLGRSSMRQPWGDVSGAIDPLPTLQERSTGRNAGISAVSAALLSARFPIVTPSGALLGCGNPAGKGPPLAAGPDCSEITYAVDGGYYENSGLMTLLQLWAAVEPFVQSHNAATGDKPQIVPWILILDNHYRSVAESRHPHRPLEVVVPLKALTGNRLVSQPALEEMAAVAMGNNETRCGAAPGVADHDAAGEPQRASAPDIGCVAVIAPRRRPTVAAPLGWVLSGMTRSDLDDELKAQLPEGGVSPIPRLEKLKRLVRGSSD